MENELVITPPRQARCAQCLRPVERRIICSDCDHMSNRLLREVTFELKTMEDKIKNITQQHDQARVDIWKVNYGNLLKEEDRVQQAFDEAMKELTKRKGEILSRMKNAVRIQKLVIDGQFSSHCRKELSKCDNNERLIKLKNFLSIPDFDQTLSSLDTGVRFQYDLSEVSKFGNIVFGDVQPAIQSTIPDVRPKVLTNPMVSDEVVNSVTLFTGRSSCRKVYDINEEYTFQQPADILNPHRARYPVEVENELQDASVECASIDNAPRAVMALEPTEPQELPLTAELLATLHPHDQKQILGNHLYREVSALYPDKAGKITGMFLELDNEELLFMLNVPDHIKCKVNEAIEVLKQHEANEAAQNQSDQYGSRRNSSSSDDSVEDWGSPKWW